MTLPSRAGRSSIEFFTLRMCNAEISCCFEPIKLRIQVSKSVILSSERSSEATASGSGRSLGVTSFPEKEDKVNVAGNEEAATLLVVAAAGVGKGKFGASFAFLLNANFEVVDEAFRRLSRVFSSWCSCYRWRSELVYSKTTWLTASQFLWSKFGIDPVASTRLLESFASWRFRLSSTDLDMGADWVACSILVSRSVFLREWVSAFQ